MSELFEARKPIFLTRKSLFNLGVTLLALTKCRSEQQQCNLQLLP